MTCVAGGASETDCANCASLYPYCNAGVTPGTGEPPCSSTEKMCEACPGMFKPTGKGTCPDGNMANLYHDRNMISHHNWSGGGGSQCFEGIQFIQILEVNYWMAKSKQVWLHTFDWLFITQAVGLVAFLSRKGIM